MGSSVLLAGLLPAFATAQSTGLDDMVGARAGQAEGELQRRGYENTGGQKGDDRSYSNWWNAERRQCVTIATMNGRYDSITPTTAPDCRKSGKNATQTGDYTRDHHDRDGQRAAGGVADLSDLQALCRARVAEKYDLRPSAPTVVAPITQRNGSATVRGWFDEGKRTTFFTCSFDENGRFVGLM